MTPHGVLTQSQICRCNQKVGLLTNLFSSGRKQLLVVAAYEGFQVTFHPRSVYMGRSHMPVHQGPGYVCVVGRHLFPHVYHKVDKMKPFSASRQASGALAMVRLPSNYPYRMYSAIAGGQQRWKAGVRPPTYNSMRVADQTAAFVLRMVSGWHTLPPAQFFQPLAFGWVGVDPAAVVVSQFLQGYHKQLRHANVMVRRSTQHGLYEAMQRFHPDMPYVRRGLSRHCRAHGTYHDRFVFYMHLLGFRISFPPVRSEAGTQHIMCRAVHAWQTNAIHEWMDAGYFSLRDAHAAGWPLASWQWELAPPMARSIHPVATDLPSAPFRPPARCFRN